MCIRVFIVIKCAPPMHVLVLQVNQLLIDVFKSLVSDLFFREIQSCPHISVDRFILSQFLAEQVDQALLLFHVIDQLLQRVPHFMWVWHIRLLQEYTICVFYLDQLLSTLSLYLRC